MKTKNKSDKTGNSSTQKSILFFLNILLLILFAAFVCLITTTKLFIDNDVFWHLATGKYIIENKVIPSADVFGFITGGVKWIPFEWGWDVITYLLYQSGGYALISVFRSIIVILLFVIVYKLSKKLNIPAALFILFSILLCFGLLTRLVMRPHLISYLFITLIIAILLYYKFFAKSNPKLLYYLPVVFLLWANIHMGVLLGIAIFFIFIVSESISYVIKKKKVSINKEVLTSPDFKKMLLVFLISIVSILVNPFFINTYIYTYSHTQMDMLDNIAEWRSPFDSAVTGFYYVKIYFFFLIAGLVTLYYSFKKKELFIAMLYIVFAIYSVFSLRYTADFMVIIFIPFLLAANYLPTAFRKSKPAQFPYGSVISNIVLCAVLLYLTLTVYNNSLYKEVLGNRFRETGLGINEKFYPVELIDFIKREKINNIGSRPFNNLRVGGYLIWELPGTKNFVDSRNLNNEIMTEYNIIDQHKAGFDEKLKNYGIDYVIYSVPYLTDNSVEIEKDLVGFLARSPDWKLVFWDDKSFLFVKNDLKFKDVIERYEYKYVTPTNFIYNRKIMVNALQSDRIRFLNELRRKISEDKNGILTNDIIKGMNLQTLSQ